MKLLDLVGRAIATLIIIAMCVFAMWAAATGRIAP